MFSLFGCYFSVKFLFLPSAHFNIFGTYTLEKFHQPTKYEITKVFEEKNEVSERGAFKMKDH